MSVEMKTLTIDNTTYEVVDEKARKTVPDWNQNDETSLDYMKNRPFYSEYSTRVLLSDTLAFVDSDGIYTTAIEADLTSIEFGNLVCVTLDGQAYETVAKDYSEELVGAPAKEGEYAVVCGNASFLGGDNTGEPFVLYVVVFGGEVFEAAFVALESTEDKHDVEISVLSETITPIPEKYLPVARENEYGVVKLSEIVRSYCFTSSSVPSEDMIEAVDAFIEGRAKIIWMGYAMIFAGRNSTTGVVTLGFGNSPTMRRRYTPVDGVYKLSNYEEYPLGSLYLRSPSGTAFEITVSNDGTLAATKMT